ncbi:LysE family translocator [Pelagibacterium limicola]|uniref:LysE family translocator n=1 Tax=Pelagibacterium limicola TaxID=2791022 RepID=UPI0018AFFD4B|nr:LysE family translocator [Pelagibacterium limicola]
MIEVYAIALVAVVLAQITPGPNLLAVAGAALAQGRRAALYVTLGVASAIFLWVTAAAMGLAVLLTVYPALLTALKLIGGGYLCYLSARALYGVWRGGRPAIVAGGVALSSRAAWRRGFFVNITNPKSGLMWGAIAGYMFGSGLSGLEVLGFAPLGFLTALLVYGAYGVLFSSGMARRVYARFARAAEAIFGLMFGALGGALFSDGIRDISR